MIIPDTPITSCERRALSAPASFRSSSFHVLLVQQGALEISYGKERFTAVLSCFYTKQEITFTPSGITEYVLLRLDPCSVYALTDRESLFRKPVTTFPGRAGRLLEDCVLEAATEAEGAQEAGSLAGMSLVLRMLRILQELAGDAPVLPEPLVMLSAHRSVLYQSLLSFIRSRCEEDLSLSETAERFSVTPQYLGRFLKETRGRTFRQLLFDARDARKRILAGLREDASSDEAPGELLSLLSDTDAAHGSDPAHTHTVRAVLDPRRAMPQYFRRLINLGYARNLRILDMDSALDYVQSEIGFACGRICRITDLIRTITIRGNSYYDFSAVFPLLDSLIVRGITPFLELGNKSLLIQETTSISYAPVSPTDSKEYYQNLLSILPEFARACINHYGQSSFDEWYFEISYMYTSDEERESFGLIQYAGMFRKIYHVLRSFSSKCRIGGPGFNDWSDRSRIRQMVRLMSSHGVVPDFFSAYIYPMRSDDSGTMHLSGDVDEGLTRIKVFADVVRSAHPDREIWITEFNSNLSSRNYLNDLPYQAAYIARMMLGTLPLGIAGIGYYLLSDAPLRYLDSLDFLFGGWGLITDRGLPKPSFHAFRIMDKLGHYLIRDAGSCLITANSRGSFQILVYRYQHPREEYLYRNVEKEDLALPHSVFENAGSDRFELIIENVLRGTYIVKDYRISRRHTDLFSVWEELDFLYPPTTATLEELRLKSALVPHIQIRRLNEGDPFKMDLDLNGTELRLITVELYASHT